MTQKDKEMAEIAQIMLSLSTKYAYSEGPKNLIAEARRVYYERNGIVKKKKTPKRFESHGPIHTAMMNLAQAKKNIDTTTLAVSKAASKYIDKGMLSYDKFYKERSGDIGHALENMTASHFVGNPNLTLACVKNDKAFSGDASIQDWNFKCGALKNREAVKDEIYVPYADRSVIEVLSDFDRQEVIPNESVSEWLQNMQCFDGNLKTDFQFVSLILSSMTSEMSGHLTQFLEKSIPTGVNTKEMRQLIQDFKTILSEKPKFAFHEPDVKSFDTMHYTTNLCQINGWYEFDINERAYVIEISRKMVISSLKRKDENVSPCNIPLCEELMLQVRHKALGDLEGTYCPYGFFISASAASAEKTGALHFLGDNAISVHMPCYLGPSADRDGDVMKQAGKLIKHLQSIHLPGSASVKHGKFFFKSLFELDRGGNFDKEGGELVKHCVARIKAQHAKNGLTEAAGITDVDIVKASFVANQHAFDLTKVYESKYHHTKLWETSKSFSMAVMSPPDYPNLNYVFVFIQNEQGDDVPDAPGKDAIKSNKFTDGAINAVPGSGRREEDDGEAGVSTPRMNSDERGAMGRFRKTDSDERDAMGRFRKTGRPEVKTKFYKSTLPLDLESELALL
jgi:hypothetical protein